jgi:hypothetical protein
MGLVGAVALLGATRLHAHSAQADSDQQMATVKQDTYTHIFPDPLSDKSAFVRTGEVYAVTRSRVGTDGKTWLALLSDDGRAVGWIHDDEVDLFTTSAP